MKIITFCLSFFCIIMLVSSCKPKVVEQPAPKKADISEFLGQWTIDIKGGTVGWLEVRKEDKYIDADLLWIGGSVTPVSNVYLAADKYLIVTMTRDVIRKVGEDNKPARTHRITEWLEIQRSGDTIFGYRLNPRHNGIGVDSAYFKGTLLPAVPPAPDLKAVKYGEPIALFNGKDLTGWRLIDPKQKNGFSVVDGVMSNNPAQVEGQPHVSYGNIRTDQEFMDFNLKLEVSVPTGGNSGVYLRGMYEIQVLDSYKKPLDPHNMGALYSRIIPLVSAEKPASQWQTLDITLCDRHVTVILNGIMIIDNQPVYGPTGGALKSDVFTAGPIYLQGDHDKVSYRNIVLTPIVK
jgi:hypothetical protein